MRCLIYAKSDETLWLKDYFPGLEPYLLKIVNKPLLEYALDLLSLLKVNEVRVVSDASIKEVEEHFGTGSKWGLKISYALARPGDSLKSVYLKNHSFCKEDDLLLWDGFFFVQYDRENLGEAFDFSDGFVCSGENRKLLYIPHGKKMSDLPSETPDSKICMWIRELSSISEYYKLSMEILTQRSRQYVLPGYSNEADAFIGINCVYPVSVNIEKPIMLGNNCRFRKHSSLGPATIIGDNVVVDENSTVIGSIVYDNTYIGADLDVENKIIYQNNLICGKTGLVVQITDAALMGGIEAGVVTSIFNRMVQKVVALIFIIIQVLPWLILYLPYSLLSNVNSEHLINKSLGTRKYADPAILCKTWWGRMLLHLCLDKFLPLWSVLCGRLYLVGNHLFVNTVQNRKLILELPVYNPGVYSLVESYMASDAETPEFYELEYINNISTRLVLKILFHTITRRVCNGNCK